MESTEPPWFILWWMKFWEFDGLATPWNTIYYRNKKVVGFRLRRHETKHIEQMKRDGKIVFLIKYNWYWLTLGYDKNPYEIEAIKAEETV